MGCVISRFRSIFLRNTHLMNVTAWIKWAEHFCTIAVDQGDHKNVSNKRILPKRRSWPFASGRIMGMFQIRNPRSDDSFETSLKTTVTFSFSVDLGVVGLFHQVIWSFGVTREPLYLPRFPWVLHLSMCIPFLAWRRYNYRWVDNSSALLGWTQNALS